MSYGSVSDLRSYGMVAVKYADQIAHPDAQLQKALDHAYGRVNGYLNVRYDDLTTAGSSELIVAIERVGAAWYLIVNDGVGPTDEGLGLLKSLYDEYYGPDGVLKQIADGDIDPGIPESVGATDRPRIIVSYTKRGSKAISCDGETEYI